jgi:hypothetical protein
MTRSYNNGKPQYPRDFLEEFQRNTMNALEQVPSEQCDSIQQAASPPAPVQDTIALSTAIGAIAIFNNQVMNEVYNLLCERNEALRHGKALREENKQMRLTIEALNETIAARDASIKELKARIESLAKESLKLQTA